MNGGRSDASTSTDDVKGRPLCLFYFSQPFGVLSPEPPTLAAAPPHLARAFLDMQPVPPFYWTAAPPPAAPAPAPAGESQRSAATGESFELGAATVHAHPVSVVSVRRALPPRAHLRPDSFCSSLFSGELWFESSCSSRGAGGEPVPARRLVPYNRILPPLRLPSARALSDCSSEEVWPRKCLHPEKFSLPPISLPAAPRPGTVTPGRPAGSGGAGACGREVRRRRLGVDKRRGRRRAAADLRRVLNALIRRAVTEGGGCSSEKECSSSPAPAPAPALLRALATLRAAWPEHASLQHRCGALSRSLQAAPRSPGRPTALPAMQPRGGPAARMHASPGMLRRRYSVPETIMRKYRLAQQCSDSEESLAPAHQSAASACPSPPHASHSPCESPHRFMRRDRELMRKSALLRRMWTRPCRAPACCCEEDSRATRSLDGSRSELSSRRSPAPRAAPAAEPKRQRLEAAAADFSDSTYRSHGARCEFSSCADATDAFSDTESRRLASPPSSERLSERPTAELESEARSLPDTDARDDRSFGDSDTLSASASLPTAKETNGSTDAHPQDSNLFCRMEGHVDERTTVEDNEDRNIHLYDHELAARSPLYELLEICVSENAHASTVGSPPASVAPLATSLAIRNGRDIDIDEYVSNILVESLNSLTDQLECMNASIGGDRRISIVEKEIKVRLQNTGVNTIVHLSPTSNNQIIFGNEELCNESCVARDECNNPLTIRQERPLSVESNNNLSSSACSGARHEVTLEPPPPPRDAVNRAVLQQIQKLFRDELRTLDEGEASPGVSLVEISNVDAYMEAHGAPRPELQISTRADGDAIAGVGAGNYFRDGEEAVAVPRLSAYPHSESMEVNTSSSSDAEAACSDCTSLVDSLDDPNSPRGALLRRRVRLARSALDVLDLLPEGARDASADSRSEAFFVRIEDDELDPDGANVRVAEYMPEKIKQRLYRRHRKRELRMECARRSKVKQLKKELERRRVEEAALARRELERDCMAIVNALIDDVVARIAQDEYKAMRARRRSGVPATTRSEEDLARRVRRKDRDDKHLRKNGSRRFSNEDNRLSERHHIHGKILVRPSLTSSDRPPRRIYQKSEIHEGEKCIEILEILEYVNESQSSSETTNSDENHNPSSKCRKSRIPIPVYERIQRKSTNDERMRLIGGIAGRTSPPPKQAHGPAALGSATPAQPLEPRSRSNSLRFKRVFDIIPEERSSLSFDSSVEDTELARRASAPEVSVLLPSPALAAAAPTPAMSPQREKSTRSAGTSPHALMEEQRARVVRSQTTMTSPCNKSAATSPLRPAAPPRPAPPRPLPPRLAREGIVCALRQPVPHRTASLAVE